MSEGARKKSRKLRGSIVRYAIPVVFIVIFMGVRYLFQPDAIDFDTAIEEAYEVNEIDLALLRWTRDNNYLCFENPTSKDERPQYKAYFPV